MGPIFAAAWACCVLAVFVSAAVRRQSRHNRLQQATVRREAASAEATRQLPAAYAPGQLPASVIREAAQIAVTAGTVSPFDLTRQIRVAAGNGRLGITAARAVLEELERLGVVGGENREGRRAALFGSDAWVDVVRLLRGRTAATGRPARK